jgi:hypothetical protein
MVNLNYTIVAKNKYYSVYSNSLNTRKNFAYTQTYNNLYSNFIEFKRSIGLILHRTHAKFKY